MRLRFAAIPLFCVLILSACNSGSRDWKNFRQKYAEDGVTIRLNGFMKWVASGILSKATDDPEAKAVVHILKKMNGIEVNIIPRSHASYTAREVDHLSEMLNRSNYQSLINIRKDDRLFNLWAKGKEDEFSDPLALINDGNEVIMVEMSGTLTAKDIQTLTNAGMNFSDNGHITISR